MRVKRLDFGRVDADAQCLILGLVLGGGRPGQSQRGENRTACEKGLTNRLHDVSLLLVMAFRPFGRSWGHQVK